MTLYTQSVQSDGTETTLRFEHGKAGLQWIISQISVETIPFRGTAQATVRLNGRYITSTISGGGSSAQGPPFITIEAADVLEIKWTGVQVNDSCITTLLYNETNWGTLPNGMGWLT